MDLIIDEHGHFINGRLWVEIYQIERTTTQASLYLAHLALTPEDQVVILAGDWAKADIHRLLDAFREAVALEKRIFDVRDYAPVQERA